MCIADGHQHVTVFNFILAELEIVLLSEDPSSESHSTFCFSSPLKLMGNSHMSLEANNWKRGEARPLVRISGQLILRGNKLDLEIMPKNPLSNKMVIYLNVFCRTWETGLVANFFHGNWYFFFFNISLNWETNFSF